MCLVTHFYYSSAVSKLFSQSFFVDKDFKTDINSQWDRYFSPSLKNKKKIPKHDCGIVFSIALGDSQMLPTDTIHEIRRSCSKGEKEISVLPLILCKIPGQTTA